MNDPSRSASTGDEASSARALAAERVSYVRHELRTFANHILGYSDMLLESARDDGLDTLLPGLQEIHRQGELVVELIGISLAPTRTEITFNDIRMLAGEVHPRIEDLQTQTKTLLETVQELGLDEVESDLHKIFTAIHNLRNFVADGMLEVCPPPAVVESPSSPEGAPANALATDHDRTAQPGQGRILIVDDVENNRDMLRRRLLRQGYTVVEASNGREALDRIAQGGLDLVLLDILMPVVDGFEVLRQVKATPLGRDLPIIMISSLDEVQSVVRCIEMGAEDFLSKPFDPVLLRARVGACLEKKRLRDHELDYLRQVETVITAASAVETGTFDPETLREIALRTDALGNLARVFQRMGTEVQAREQRLQKQVTQLKIEIDESRKQRQIAEVTETEYFQELKQRAQELRRRSGKSVASEPK